jgi:hypothetical protein
MPPVRNIRNVRPIIYIPTDSNTVVKIVITTDDGTDYTLLNTYTGSSDSNFCLNAEVTRPVTDKLGSFSIRIVNDGGLFYNTFNGGEVVKIYADVTDASTLIFYGKVDNVMYGLNMTDGFFIDLNGRDYPELIDQTVTGIETSGLSSVAMARILYNFYSDITLAFWNETTWAEATFDPLGSSGEGSVNWNTSVSNFPSTLINMTYQYKKGYNVITEICQRAGLDCYMYYDITLNRWFLRTFLQSSIITTNGVSYGTNLINVDGFGIDTTEVYNRIIVFGKTDSDNVLLLKTKDDTGSQTNLWIKEKVLNEQDLVTMDDVNDKATYELANSINVTTPLGKLTSICLPNLNPGEVISVSIPYCGINGSYKVQSLTHSFNDFFTTTIEVTKKAQNFSDLFVPKINYGEFTSGINNPNAMKDSYTIFFDDANQFSSLINTQLVGGVLNLVPPATTGSATSITHTTDYDVIQCEFRKYDAIGGGTTDVYEVSNNGGATWETYDMSTGEPHTFSVLGNNLAFRITLNSTSSAYESVSLLYK